jgi:hypothetical protein
VPDTAPPGPVNVMAMDDAVTASLNVAVTFAEVGTPIASGAGAREVTVGAVPSAAVVSKTTSTQ